MNKYLNIAKALCLGAAVTMGVTACNDDNDWQPGEVDTAPGVFFTTDNPSMYVLLSTDGTVASLKLARLNPEGELTVPINIISKSDDMVVPDKVTFADGSETATFDVECAGLPSQELANLHVEIPSEYVNKYANGSGVYDGQVILTDWEEVANNPVLVEFVDYTYATTPVEFDPVESTMWYLPGTTRYRVDNFINTDTDFIFDLSPSKFYSNCYTLTPGFDHIYTYAEFDWTSYGLNEYFYTFDADEFPVAELTTLSTHQPAEMWWISFAWYSDTAEYTYVYPTDDGLVAHITATGYYDEAGSTYVPRLVIKFTWQIPSNEE